MSLHLRMIKSLRSCHVLLFNVNRWTSIHSSFDHLHSHIIALVFKSLFYGWILNFNRSQVGSGVNERRAYPSPHLIPISLNQRSPLKLRHPPESVRDQPSGPIEYRLIATVMVPSARQQASESESALDHSHPLARSTHIQPDWFVASFESTLNLPLLIPTKII